MDATFRPRRSLRNQGLGYLVGFLAWGALNITMVLWTSDAKHRPGAMAMTGGVSLFMAGLALQMLVAAWREELSIRGSRVVAHGIVRRREIDLGDVTEARWGLGRVVLRGEVTRIPVVFSNYEAEESDRIIRHLHATLRPEVQTGWNLFIYLRERRERRLTRIKPGPDEILVGRNRWDRIFAPSLVAACLIGIAAWRLMGGLRFLAAPLPILILWGLSRAMTPAKGMVLTRFAPLEHPETTRFFVFLLAWALVGLIGFSIDQYVRPGLRRPADSSLIVGMVMWFAVLMIEGTRLERATNRRLREAADLAAKGRGEFGADPGQADWR